uniref:Uncharacterized protein n=1 Tax=Electrophorus electricus TaxID=8005 RepID=A0A4W4FK66_ELEEL
VHGDEQRRGGGEDQLQAPEAHVGDGEEVVVADVLTAGLQRVAHEIGLLVAPHCLGRHHQHAHAEDEKHRQPDLAQAGGVAVDSCELGVQCTPVHSAAWSASHELNV